MSSMWPACEHAPFRQTFAIHTHNLSHVMRKPVYAMCEQHPRNLISAFVVRCLDSIIPLVSITEISSLYLDSVAAQGGFCLSWSQTLKTGFLVTRLIYGTRWSFRHTSAVFNLIAYMYIWKRTNHTLINVLYWSHGSNGIFSRFSLLSEQVITTAVAFTANTTDTSHIPVTDCFQPFVYPCT